jgi:hypothetical protein
MGIFGKAFQKRKDKLALHASAQMEPGETVHAVAICQPAAGGAMRLISGRDSWQQAGLMATDRNLYVFPLHPLKGGEVLECILKQANGDSDLRCEGPNVVVGEYQFVTVASEKKARDAVAALLRPTAPA